MTKVSKLKTKVISVIRGLTITEIISMILILIFIILIYISNRKNKVNKWGAFSGFLFWLGTVKEVYLIYVIPYLKNALKITASHELLAAPYSLMSWASNILAIPAAVFASLYFYGMDKKNPKLMRFIGVFLCVSAAVFLFLFPPFSLYDYELEIDAPNFWRAHIPYNIALGAVFTFFVVKGVLCEKSGKVKTQKLLVALIILPVVIHTIISVFFHHYLGIDQWFWLWAGNAAMVVLGLVLYVYMVFKNGAMGLRLSKENYNWTSDMDLINKGAEYTSHILKNQTDKMEWCIENLKAGYSRSKTEPPEELFILSRSLSALKTNVDKIKKHSEVISLHEETASLKELLESSSLLPDNGAEVRLNLLDDVCFICDKTHINEVFTNIILNAYEAIKSTGNTGTIDITGEYDEKKRFYLVRFADNGVGMDDLEMENIFKPYFTTKNTEKNFGLGLAYCKNVIEKHEGYIKAESTPGKGSVIIVALPEKRIIKKKE